MYWEKDVWSVYDGLLFFQYDNGERFDLCDLDMKQELKKVRTNDSKVNVTLKNWEDEKLQFLNYRLSLYEDDLTREERISFELDSMRKRSSKHRDTQAKIQRYIKLMESDLGRENSQSKELDIFTSEKSKMVFKFLDVKWKYSKNIRYTYIFNAMMEKGYLLPMQSDYQRFIRKLINNPDHRIEPDKALSSQRSDEAREWIESFESNND